MARLKLIRLGDTVEANDVNRIQQNVATAFEQAAAESNAGNVVSVTADYLVKLSDFIVFVDASRGAIRVTLSSPGQLPVIVRKTDKSDNPVTVTSSRAIDGSVRLTVAMPVQTYAYDPASKGWLTI